MLKAGSANDVFKLPKPRRGRWFASSESRDEEAISARRHEDEARCDEEDADRSGRAETEAAAAICEQLGRGVPDGELARSLPAMLSAVGRRQAPTVVDLVKRYYCP